MKVVSYTWVTTPERPDARAGTSSFHRASIHSSGSGLVALVLHLVYGFTKRMGWHCAALLGLQHIQILSCQSGVQDCLAMMERLCILWSKIRQQDLGLKSGLTASGSWIPTGSRSFRLQTKVWMQLISRVRAGVLGIIAHRFCEQARSLEPSHYSLQTAKSHTQQMTVHMAFGIG